MDDAKLVAASAIALAVTLFTIFWMRPIARRLGLVDMPDARKCHRGRVPLIGGLCFSLGTIAGLLYLGYVDRFVASLLVPCALIVMTGAVDDISNLSVRPRLIIQICAAGLVVASTGVYLDYTGQVFGTEGFNLGLFGIPVTLIAVIGLINAFNMLDGIDGLAASLAMVSIGAILLFANVDWPVLGVMLMLQVLFASLIPYLCVNLGWPDGRKIFMGDAGSTLIGFLLGWSLIYLTHRGVARLSPVDALWCVALPVMDTLAVMVRRMRKGRSPFKADRQHLHHLLHDTGCSPRVVLAAIVGASGALALTGYALRTGSEMVSGAVFLALLVAYTFGFQRALTAFCSALRQLRPAPTLAEYTDAIQLVHEARSVPTMKPHSAVLRTLCILTTPPDAIRIAPIAHQLSLDARFDSKVCVAAQPDQTPAQVLHLFGIEPDMRLRVAERGYGPSEITSNTLGGMKRVLRQFKPDVVLIPGDACTTLASTLAALYHQIPVIRIEPESGAGHNPSAHMHDASRDPACTLASLHFAPSESASRFLLADGVPAERIVISGNTAIATLRVAAAHIREDEVERRHLAQCFAFLRASSTLILMTDEESLHFDATCVEHGESENARNESNDTRHLFAGSMSDDAFEPICRALRRVAMRRPDIDIVYPVARPAEVIEKIRELLRACPNVHLVAPTDYLSFAYLVEQADLILADARALAAEVASLGKPVLALQDAAGVGATGVGTDAGKRQSPTKYECAVATGILAVLNDQRALDALRHAASHDVHRDACASIVEALAERRHSVAAPILPRQPMTQVQSAPQVLREVS